MPYGAFGQTSYAANAFAEAAIDMTALIGTFDPCLSYGFRTIMIKTKSSQSSSASIADFIDPIQYLLRVGLSASAGPDQTRCAEGASTAFPLQGQATAGVQPIASTTWSVVSGTATIDSPGSLTTTAHVSSAAATLRLTVTEAGGCTAINDITLTVSPVPPACSIAGPAVVCPGSSPQFLAPPGATSYSWSVTGNGSISGPANQQTVTVAAGSACAAKFTLALAGHGCSTSCTTDVMVNDNTRPSLVVPADVVLECSADTSTNANGTATAQDDCGQVTLRYSDAATNVCGGAKIISRTWTATDPCGNSTQAVQTLIIPFGKSPVTLTNLPDVISDQTCANRYTITRSWVARDACGNIATFSSQFRVNDTTPPKLACQPDRTVQASDAWSFDVPTATDDSGAATVRELSTVSNLLNQTTLAITRTWEAVDACGNSATCQQTITLQGYSSVPPPTIQPQSQTVQEGDSATFSVTAAGDPPFACQWRCNGTNLVGATNSSLVLSASRFTDAGLYSVLVSNAQGTVASSTAVLNVMAKLVIQSSGTVLTLTWADPFVLQWATNNSGPYTDVPGATSPYSYDTANGQKFFRLRPPTFSLKASSVSGGIFSLSVPSMPGCNVVIQASSNLTTWVNLQTNLTPWVFVESNSWKRTRGFYRATLAP